jgi:hypothetical protein
MKTTILTSILILFLVCSLSAQRRFYPKNFFGVYGGVNISGFYGEYQSNIEGESGKFRLRTQYGLFGNIYFQQNISLYLALDLVFKGAFTRGYEYPAGNAISYVAKTNLTALSLPVLFNYTPIKQMGVMIGPQLTYLFAAKEPWYKSDIYKPENYQENVLYKFNQVTVDGVLAINYAIYSGVTFQFRYTFGLMPIVKTDYGNARSSSFLFYVGYVFTKQQ